MDSNILKERKARWKKLFTKLKKLFPKQQTDLHYSNALELVIAVVLSAQTTDKQVNVVTSQFFSKYKTLDDYCALSVEQFKQDIRSVNYFNNKAKHIIAMTHKIKDEFDGEVPGTMKELMNLPGVGRKTANVVIANMWPQNIEGIAVDTHVQRFAVRFGLTDYTKPTDVEKDLVQVIPKLQWASAPYYMIQYGRAIGPARPYDISQDPLIKIYPPAGKRFKV